MWYLYPTAIGVVIVMHILFALIVPLVLNGCGAGFTVRWYALWVAFYAVTIGLAVPFYIFVGGYVLFALPCAFLVVTGLLFALCKTIEDHYEWYSWLQWISFLYYYLPLFILSAIASTVMFVVS
jgi:hypothetical protein